MAARFFEETESGRDGSATEPVITAGVNRSGKKRLVPLDVFGGLTIRGQSQVSRNWVCVWI